MLSGRWNNLDSRRGLERLVERFAKAIGIRATRVADDQSLVLSQDLGVLHPDHHTQTGSC